MKTLMVTIVMVLSLVRAAQADTIAVFDNPAYVSTTVAGASSDALQALLVGQGHSVSTFTGISAAAFNTAAATADLLLFPDLLNFGQLASDLDAAAKAALASYVSGGGGVIVVGGSGMRLLNAAFYPTCDFVTVFCFASSGSAGGSLRDDTVATGTPYAAGPAALTVAAADGAVNPFAFTPPGGLNLYRDVVGGSFNSTTVLTAPFGAGQYGYLAFTFEGATPATAGGWDQVLGIMVDDVAVVPQAVPVPAASSFWLVALFGPLLAARQRFLSRTSSRGADHG